MIFIEHASLNDRTIKENFGAPEYSYLFVKRAFQPVLDRLGERVEVADPAREVEPIFRAAEARGEPCVFLSYNPPHKTPLGLACPTIPVFAWEYDRIPDETWDDDPRNDWRHGLLQTGMAITHCRSAATAVRSSLGDDYPIWVAPAPLFERFNTVGAAASGWREPFDVPLDGAVAISAGEVDLSLFRPERGLADGVEALRLLDRVARAPGRASGSLRLEGVVYTSVLAPADGRKNWRDLVTAFVWAFRATPTATLVLKLTHAAIEHGLAPVLGHIATLGAFACRIVLLHGMLANEAYATLVAATSYAVNASTGEGQCLPLMEYMSAGRPAVTPAHSAMADYVSPSNAFVVKSDLRPAAWPQDERAAIRCRQHMVSFESLVDQFRESYQVATSAPARYDRMSAGAVRALKAFCSEAVVAARIQELLTWVEASGAGSHRIAAR